MFNMGLWPTEMELVPEPTNSDLSLPELACGYGPLDNQDVKSCPVEVMRDRCVITGDISVSYVSYTQAK